MVFCFLQSNVHAIGNTAGAVMIPMEVYLGSAYATTKHILRLTMIKLTPIGVCVNPVAKHAQMRENTRTTM